MKLKLFFQGLLFLNVSLIGNQINAQWNQYNAMWEGEPGVMMVNMNLHDIAPLLELPYLLELKSAVFNCDELGQPEPEALQRIEDQFIILENAIGEQTYLEYAGRFLYQCQVKDYIYINDTTSIPNLLKGSSKYTFNYRLKFDPEWHVYSDFIYPDPFLYQTMSNRSIIEIMREEGYDLSVKYPLKHYASFNIESDRWKYRTFLLEQNFKIVELDFREGNSLPYEIHFSRNDKLVLDNLSNITLRLNQRAEFLNGKYEGWEVEIKE